MMQKKLKRVMMTIGMIMALLLCFIAVSYINHKIQLKKEDKLFVPTGKMVEVNKHKMHVYATGQGMATLVFMSGGGTCSPVLDFKSLYDLLSDEYRIVVVEKAGYGFSEIANVPRDIDTILEETREALLKAGEIGPYILFAHSMSGIEAIYWAQKYPKEVKAIVGLDPAVPSAYDNMEFNKTMLDLGAIAAKMGVLRWMPNIVNDSAAIKEGALTEQEKELYRAIFYRRTATPNMLAEVNEIKASAKKVKDLGIPEVPMFFFISNGKGTGWKSEEWRTYLVDYIEQSPKNQYIQLNCSHYVHDIEYERIAKESRDFISNSIGLR